MSVRKMAPRGLVVALVPLMLSAQEIGLRVRADHPSGRVSRYLTGACIEDVNHEIYGGLYSQMVYGESFQEPVEAPPPRGFVVYGGFWRCDEPDTMEAPEGAGFKLVSQHPAFGDGELAVEVLFPDKKAGNAGVLVKVNQPQVGADKFHGYEVALSPESQTLRLARHKNNFENIRDTPCEVPVGVWIPLSVRMAGATLEVFVAGKRVIRHDDAAQTLASGGVGLRTWQRGARFRNLSVKADGAVTPLPFVPPERPVAEVSKHWRMVSRGSAEGRCVIDRDRPFIGRQSQRLVFERGSGELGVENQGLNRAGMCFREGRPYEGVLWGRTEKPGELRVALESEDGSRIHAERSLALAAGDWQRLTFTLVPKAAEAKGRFVVSLKGSGSVTLGYAFLQPGEWGRFKGLPVRRDVAEAMIDEGITVLRYGGSMINSGEYRWKKMIGPRDRRPPYACIWYDESSNGWGIPDFLDFCEAAGFLAIPTLNVDETPQDMADFLEYVNGPAESPWGARRVADGHPQPYHLRHVSLGNEEKVNAAYAAKFKALAETIWAKDKNMVITVGDFLYNDAISDLGRLTGAASGIKDLDGQRQVLELAKRHGREVWFDIHLVTQTPGHPTVKAFPSYVDALARLGDGANGRAVVYELNAGIHSMHRALGNAAALIAIERDGRLPVVCSANGLQVDGQNDNAWDQGLLFMNPSRVWLQPPGYVMRMVSRGYQPLAVPVEIAGAPADIGASAKLSEDRKTLVVQVVNCGKTPRPVRLRVDGFAPAKESARVEELAAGLDDRNTAAEPLKVCPRQSEWRHGLKADETVYTVPGYSFTVLRFE